MDGGAVCVFAKVPVAGRVKTRLAKAVGDAQAAALAAAFLEDTVAALAGLSATVVIAFDDEPPERWSTPPPLVWQQGSGSLDARIERVLGQALASHPWAIALGADSPGLPPERVRLAIEALARADGPGAVLGPCRDGGFYLLGVRALVPGTLRGVRWSTPHALEDTTAALGRAGMSTTQLEGWFDIDQESDLKDLVTLIARGEIHAPATERVLEGTT